MKKILPFIVLMSMAVVAKSQDPAIIMRTAKSIGSQISFTLDAYPSITVQIDFGDGTKVSKTINGRTTITGTLVGSQIIRIYGAGICVLDCVSCDLLGIDVTNCSELVTLSCGSNQLTSIDVTQNSKLYNYYCNNNKLTAIDVSKNADLHRLDFSSNQLTSVDLSANPALISLVCRENKLTSLDVSKNLLLEGITCQNNLLTQLDLSKNTVLSRINCGSNQLSNLDVSNNTLIDMLWCYDNQLTFATLPPPSTDYTYYTYYPQKRISVTKTAATGTAVDLSTEYSILGNNTAYMWKTKAGDTLVENTDYTIAEGKTIFLKTQTDSVYCQMTNASFPEMKENNILKTTRIKIKRDQHINFNTIPEKKVNEAPFNLVASASSKLPLTFTCSDPSVASINGAKLTIIKSGTATITATQAGNDTLMLASATQTLTITPATSITGEIENADITLFPNPATDILYIKGTCPANTAATIYTITGEKVWTGLVNAYISIAKLPAGTYILKLCKDNRDIDIKFVKQ